MVGVSRATVSRMVKAGQLKLNKFGKVSISEVDRALQGD
jgi:DNA-binding transcriptional regulator PaaX